jgi:hypothetical protein
MRSLSAGGNGNPSSKDAIRRFREECFFGTVEYGMSGVVVLLIILQHSVQLSRSTTAFGAPYTTVSSETSRNKLDKLDLHTVAL